MSKTLITFIGKGRPDKDGGHGYMMAAYDFGGDIICRSSCFAEAIRQSGKFDFDEVLFIGTPTSSWSSLFESIDEKIDIWERLYDLESKETPLDDKLQNELLTVLKEIWQKPVRISLNPKELTTENCHKILNQYIGEILASGSDILLDVTHSFRWMPLLLTSALQYKNAYHGPGGRTGEVEMIYGEYSNGGVSPVRYLDVLVKGQRNADAISLFFQKFEAEPLAKALESGWREGADAIRQIGRCIQGNLFLQLLFDNKKDNYPPGEPLIQLIRACENFSADGCEQWVSETRNKLVELFEKLVDGDPSIRLLKLADMLASRQLYGQAIILVCLAAEQSLLLSYGELCHPGYDNLQSLADEFKRNAMQQYSRYFSEIRDLRNQIAHGGIGTGSNTLKEQYEKVKSKQQKLHNYLQRSYQP